LATTTFLQKTGSKTGFHAENPDRLVDRVLSGPNFRQEKRTGLKVRNRTCESFYRQDRVPRQNPVLLENLSQVPPLTFRPVLLSCRKFGPEKTLTRL